VLRILCLGQFSVLRDGQPLGGATAQRRRLAVLALLVHAGERGLSRNKLISLLWPDADEERARRIVSQAVYALRRDLGSESVIQGLHELRLAADEVTSDLEDFRRAQASGDPAAAAAVYGGPLFGGLALPEAPEFERWLEDARRALDHDYVMVLERAALAADARFHHPDAISWWRKLAALEPHNPRVALRLMRALAASGDRPGALRHASVYEALLHSDLQLAPDPEVRAYAAELRAAPAAPLSTAQTAPPAAAVPPEDAPDRGFATPQPAVATLPRRRRSIPTLRWVVAAVLAGLALALLVFLRREGPALDASRIVVVPLENRTGEPRLDPVGQMAAEWITHGLSRTGLVRVVDAQSMLEATRNAGDAGGRRPLRLIAEETGAGLVVSGSYYRENDDLRFQTTISEARSGRIRHTADLVRVALAEPREALEPLRQKIIGGLAVLLDNRLNNWTAESSRPPTYDAYQEFLIGMEAFGVDFEEALRHFNEAARLDSTYWQALLWAGMSYANLRRYPPADSVFRILNRNRAQLAPYDQANLDYFDGGFVHGDWERSYQGARRMVELAPAAGHARFALGLTAIITNRPAEAIAVFRRIDTGRGWGNRWEARIDNLIARAHHQLGRHEEELRWARRTIAAEPNTGWTRLAEVRALAALGRFEQARQRAEEAAPFPETRNTWEPFVPGEFLYEAGRELRAHGSAALSREFFQRAVDWYRGAPPPGTVPRSRRLGLAAALYGLGQWDEAREVYAGLLAEDPNDVAALGGQGVIAQRAGDREGAELNAARLERERRPYLFGAPRYWAARIVALGGDRQRAVRLLVQARREGAARIYHFHLEQDLDSLREYPPYIDLLTPRASTPP
jgi:DNA-binding SARP family transcriptional activator/TolB-like protein